MTTGQITPTVHDVAAYILEQRGPMTAMKLQKLCYYAQAWYLVWEERPLFNERIEAWANGPVCPELYRQHRGRFQLTEWPDGQPGVLDARQKDDIDIVLDFYADMPAHELSELTHREPPWHDARDGLRPGDRGSREITHAAMAEYYESLVATDEEREA